MRVVCTGAREVPDGWRDEHTARLLRLGVPQDEAEAEPVSSACGRTFDPAVDDGDPGLAETWDVKTDDDGTVIERHAAVVCPYCGTATFISEAV